MQTHPMLERPTVIDIDKKEKGRLPFRKVFYG